MRVEIEAVVRRILRSPERLRLFFAEGGAAAATMLRFRRTVLPRIEPLVVRLHERAQAIPDDLLREQALAALRDKAFHIAGACIFATWLPPYAARDYVETIVPLEAIYDYLDNLCDRHPIVTPQAFATLHGAVADALDPAAPVRDYYAFGPHGNDGGYLAWLVRTVQRRLARLADRDALGDLPSLAAHLYGEMQSIVHLPPGERECICVDWYERRRGPYIDLDWHEFTAAAGSQLHVYAPIAAIFAGRPEVASATFHAYFPYACAVHVLLDSFLDRDDDRRTGDLNFTIVYPRQAALRARIAHMLDAAFARVAELPSPHRHRAVLRAMMLFYLSHPALPPEREAEAIALLRTVPRAKGRMRTAEE